MGAWGPYPFESDAGLDWLGELEEADDLRLVERTLAIAAEDGSEDWEVVERDREILAAGEIVAAVFGLPSEHLHSAVLDWLEERQRLLEPQVIPYALRAVRRVLAVYRGSAWWAEETSPEEQEHWLEPICDLEKRLAWLAMHSSPRPVSPERWSKAVRLTREEIARGPTADEGAWQQGRLSVPPQRMVRFPDYTVGTLSTYDWDDDSDFPVRNRLCLARGAVTVPAGKAVELDVRGRTPDDLASLAALGPRDLQSLYLWDEGVTDEALRHILSLAGLIRLDLSNGTQVTDAGLQKLTRLINLRWLRVNYDTVTPTAVRAFRHALPACDIK